MRGAWQLAALAANGVAAWGPVEIEDWKPEGDMTEIWPSGGDEWAAPTYGMGQGWTSSSSPVAAVSTSIISTSATTSSFPVAAESTSTTSTAATTSSSPVAPVSYSSFSYSNASTVATSSLSSSSIVYPTSYSSAPSVAPVSYSNFSSPIAPVSTSESLTTVTDYTTIYTTTCPATSYITSGEQTYTSTYLTTSLTTEVVTLTSTLSEVSSTPESATTPASSAPVSAVAVSSSSAAVPVVTSTSVEEATLTQTVYTTEDVTITSCEATVTDCPASNSSSASPTGSSAASNSSLASPTGSSASESSTSACALPSSPLTNEQQVGNSTWGTLCQPTFPKWLNTSSDLPYSSAPWGNRTTKNSDPTNPGDIPVTNVTRYYNFTIKRSLISADGVLRNVILVNDQYPGPLIEANWGDWIEVIVNNEIYEPDEGTSLHWHGMLQKETPWYDGVPAIGQCPIAPGHSFTYRYRAELYGSSWYHAHYSAQYTAGVVGPMQIYGPTQLPYDIDIGPVMLSDWYHVPYFSIVSDAVGTNLSLIPPTSDTALINGRNKYNCSEPSYGTSDEWMASNIKSNLTWTCVENAELSKFQFQSGKTHRLRLINYGADGVQKFSIDGHTMTVIAIDYVPVTPFTTGVVTLGVAQRTDVLVTANNNTQSMYWMRTEIAPGVSCGGSSNPQALAAIYYEGADTSATPTTSTTYNSTICANDPLDITTPEYSITPSANPYQQDLELTLVLNSTGSYEWQVNNQTYRSNFNHPILFSAAEGNVSYPYDPQWNVYNFNNNASILINVTNGTPFAHPFHLHGHNFYVLSESTGVWNGTVVNPTNPMRRDVQLIQPLGYMAIQLEADNPGKSRHNSAINTITDKTTGVWPFHCHVAWHLSGGLAINVMSRPGDIPTIPDVMPQTCVDWDYYSNHNIVDQIDAGS